MMMVNAKSTHDTLCQMTEFLDQSRQELNDTQLRLEGQVQTYELQFLQEREQNQILTERLTEETNRADQLAKELLVEQEQIIVLIGQIEALQGEGDLLKVQLDHEKKLREDLQRRLAAAEARIETLNRELGECKRISYLQKQLEESNMIYQTAKRRAMILFPIRFSIITGSSAAAMAAGFAVAGPPGAVLSCMAAQIGSITAAQKFFYSS